MTASVVHVITTLTPGGAENHLLTLATEQAKRGHMVRVAWLKGRGEMVADFTANGVATVSLGLRRYGEIRPLRRLAAMLREAPVTIVHAHMPPAELYVRGALLVNRDARTPFVISKHNTEPFIPRFGLSPVGRWVAARAARIIAISDAARDYTASVARLAPGSRITVIRYGIDSTSYRDARARREAARAALGIARDGFAVGTIARLVPQKRVDLLLRAFAAADGRARHLIVIGDGPLDAELRALATSLGVVDRVLWLGRRPRAEIPSLLAALDLFALTSDYEGLGLVLLEAMATGVPIVATRVGPIPEIVRDGVAGRLVPADDVAALTDAIVRAAAGDTAADPAAAAADLAARFAIPMMTDAVEACYVAAGAAP